MNSPARICAFYSRGPHYQRLLKTLRTQYPEATLHAVVPPSFPPEVLQEVANEVRQTETAEWRLSSPGSLLRLLRQLRAERYDLFVTLFDSPKLRVLAALSGARVRQHYTVDGRLLPLRLAPLRNGIDAVRRNVRGRILYAYLRYVVYSKPVQKA